MNTEALTSGAIALLQQLIATPSFSKEEDKTATLIEKFLTHHQHTFHRQGNNVWAITPHYEPRKPTLLLNSHHDTVKPNKGYTRDPFSPDIVEGKLFGLGSNDAGGCVVSLLSAFVHVSSIQNFPLNVVVAITAEEEISGTQGIESIWSALPAIDMAIVGEPTRMEMAVAEKGLLVLDCVQKGKAGHAAHHSGAHAIYDVMKGIEWIREFSFPKKSKTLGDVKMTVTIIHAGDAHNQVPAECAYTIDVRVTDAYTLEEVNSIIQQHIQATATPRSLRMRPSGLSEEHPLWKAAVRSTKKMYGSPTTSDRALIPVPSIKLGPGDSTRSHSADEFIFIDEIKTGIEGYVQFIHDVASFVKE